ncbi:MAG: alpha/beta fold hydrolase [Candidatus Andersenbacteria bacterium]
MSFFRIGAGLLVISLAAGAAYAYGFLSRPTAGENVSEVLDVERADTALPVPTPPAPSSELPVSSVSLAQLQQQDFRGTDFTVGQVLAEQAAYVRYYITYMSGDLKISGVMNAPRGEGPFPVLILNHGYIDPQIYTNGRGLKREQDYLARQGYVVVHPDYRNHADSDADPTTDLNLRLGYIEDVINVVYALRAANLPYVDGERIGMLGHSMGGGVTLGVLVTQPELVQGAVLLAPVSADATQNFERWIVRRPELASRIIEQFGSVADNPQFWQGISAKTYLPNIQAPVAIHHGSADDSVPLQWSQELAVALQDNKKNSVLHVYEAQPHEFTTAWPVVMQRTTAFFDEHVKS